MDPVNVLRAHWDRIAAWAVIAGGLLALLLGYRGVSGTPHVAAQLPYFVSGGLVGIFLLTVGGLLWLSADLRDDWRELRAIRALLEQNGHQTTDTPSSNGDHVAPLVATDLQAEPLPGTAVAEPVPVTDKPARRPRVRTRALTGRAEA